MKLSGEIIKAESNGEGIIITIGNVRRFIDGRWGEYRPHIDIYVNLSQANKYPIGRIVNITVNPR
jgi:hypothetical protein